MKKAISCLFVSMFLMGTAYSAPVLDLEPHETVAGINSYNLNIELSGSGQKVDGGKTHATDFFVQTAISDKHVLGIETINGKKTWRSGSDFLRMETTFTDLYLHTVIDENTRLIVGNRHFDTSVDLTYGSDTLNASGTTDELFYGLGFKAPFSDKAKGYASFIKMEHAFEWQAGVSVSIAPQAAFDVSYKHYKEEYGDADLTLKGLGFGVNYKF